MSQRRNKNVKASMEVYLVADDNQALATAGASLVGAGTALNISDKMLGVMGAEHGEHVAFGEFLAAADTPVESSVIQIVAGTPKSSAINTVDPFNVGDRAMDISGKIKAGNILSVSTTAYAPGEHNLKRVHTVSGQAVSTDYKAYINVESVRKDREYGTQNRDTLISAFKTPAAATNMLDYVLQKMAHDFNIQSELLVGNKQVVVFGINAAGGSGTLIGGAGGLQVGDSVPFITYNGITYSVVITTEMLATMTTSITALAGLAASTIEVIDITTAGAAAKVDELLVMGLDESLSQAYDGIKQVKTRVRVTLDDLLTHTVTELSSPKEAVNEGRGVNLRYRKRAALSLGYLENHDHGDYFISPVSYVNPLLNYNITYIEYFEEDLHISGRQDSPKIVAILLPSAITNPTAEAGTAFTVATTELTTLAALNALLGVWLAYSSDNYRSIKYLGAATKAAPFV